ncbi:MAG: response regulator [Candidatus Saccharibacteria bacterium]
MAKGQPAILVVEDDPALNDAYKMILSTAGYTTQTAFNGVEALAVTERFSPDIIFLDLRMPVLDGIGFLKKYQSKTKHKHVKIIIFSNYDMQSEVDEAFRLGAERYVLKAWASPSELVKIVQDLS